MEKFESTGTVQNISVPVRQSRARSVNWAEQQLENDSDFCRKIEKKNFLAEWLRQ